jgi:hypothetical protein
MFWIGVVVDPRDPDKAGKVKVRILGAHHKLSDADCPWIPVIMPCIYGGTSEATCPPPALQKNANVFGIAFDGQMMQQNAVLGICTNKAVVDGMAQNGYGMNLAGGNAGGGSAGGGDGTAGNYEGKYSGISTNTIDLSDTDISHCEGLEKNAKATCEVTAYGRNYDEKAKGQYYTQGGDRETTGGDCSSMARRRAASIIEAMNKQYGYEVIDSKFLDTEYFGSSTYSMRRNSNFDEYSEFTNGAGVKDVVDNNGPGTYIVVYNNGQTGHTMTITKNADGTYTNSESGSVSNAKQAGVGRSAYAAMDNDTVFSRLEVEKKAAGDNSVRVVKMNDMMNIQ